MKRLLEKKQLKNWIDQLNNMGMQLITINSGATAVLKSVKKQYIEKGIKKNRIISDIFLGAK